MVPAYHNGFRNGIYSAEQQNLSNAIWVCSSAFNSALISPKRASPRFVYKLVYARVKTCPRFTQKLMKLRKINPRNLTDLHKSAEGI